MAGQMVCGGGGVGLYVESEGNGDGRPILFIHGFSQSVATWREQFCLDLAQDFRLVAFDLRGHGRSDKPIDAYGDGKFWADDVHAVIRTLELDRPVLVGWSYAGFIICDYLRLYGEQDVAGVNFVGAPTSITPETADQVLDPRFIELLPGFFSDDVSTSVCTLDRFVDICSAVPPAWERRCEIVGYNALVPPHVRLSMLSRTIDNGDLLPALNVPVLISHGDRDAIVRPEVARWHGEVIANAELSRYESAGHALFSDDAARFNRELRDLRLSVQ